MLSRSRTQTALDTASCEIQGHGTCSQCPFSELFLSVLGQELCLNDVDIQLKGYKHLLKTEERQESVKPSQNTSHLTVWHIETFGNRRQNWLFRSTAGWGNMKSIALRRSLNHDSETLQLFSRKSQRTSREVTRSATVVLFKNSQL